MTLNVSFMLLLSVKSLDEPGRNFRFEIGYALLISLGIWPLGRLRHQ